MPTSFFTVPQPAGELEIPTTSGEIVPLEGMADAAFRRLIDRFRRPRTKELLSVIVEEVQEVEDAVEQTYFNTLLVNAEGVNLDVIGRRVGEPRAGRLDEPYRAAIRTAILANVSEGRIEDYIAICRSLIPTATVKAVDYYPCDMAIIVSTLAGVAHSNLVNLLERARTGGVRLEISYGKGVIGSVDGTVPGLKIGSADGAVAGFSIASTT